MFGTSRLFNDPPFSCVSPDLNAAEFIRAKHTHNLPVTQIRHAENAGFAEAFANINEST